MRQIDAKGNIIENWKVKNPFITACSFGDLNYENEEIMQISLTIKYDWAELDMSVQGLSTGDYAAPPAT